MTSGAASGGGGMRRADLLKYGALVVLVVQNSSLALCMRYSRARGGDMYLSSTAVVMSEMVKLVTALALIGAEEGSTGALGRKLYQEMVVRWYDFAKLLVPAVLYTVQNNLAYIAVSNLDAATYQVLYQLKILTTAVFAVLLLRRRLDCGKWLSLLILVAGVSLVQLSSLSGKPAASAATTTTGGGEGNTMLGLACVLLACCSSGFAGIWFEKVLKGSECSVWVRNVELALIGGCAGLAAVYSSDAAAVAEAGFFQGYSPLVWCVILLQALGGIVVAVVIKYADNLLKGFATSISIVLSCLVSYAVFGEITLSPQFLLGTALVILSTLMYSTSPAELCGLGGGKANSASSSSSGVGVDTAAAAAAAAALDGKGRAFFGSGGAHGAGALLLNKGQIPLTDHHHPEEGQGLLKEIALTDVSMEEGEGLSPRPEAAGHRRRAPFG